MKFVLEERAFEHKGMFLRYVQSEQGLLQLTFNCEKELQEPVQALPFPNFELAVAGKPYGHSPALVSGMTQLPAEMTMENFESTEKSLTFVYKHPGLGLKVKAEMELIPGAAVIRQRTTVINEGKTGVVLTHLSSMCMQGIATDGCRPWYDSDKIRVHYCRQAWNGEGQWRQSDLESLGLYPTSVHPCAGSVHFSSVGSWSTGRYLPMAVIEDLETNKAWYFQIETSSSWQYEIGHRGSWTDDRGALFVQAGGANERYGGFAKHLAPGESFTTVPVAVGCCTGGFTGAVRQLTKYRRHLTSVQGLRAECCPVVYNDYMNTLWGNPTKEKLSPLVDAAAEAGCEYFCIDAGWFNEIGVSWGHKLGDWQPSRNRFGDEGVAGMLARIRESGMKPGLWLEMEVCGEEAEMAGKPDHWFIRRYDIRAGGGARWFLNFEQEEVREYVRGVIDRLAAMGVRYIKNDYNLCLGTGDDTGGRSAAEGLVSAMEAFYDFIDETRERHPGLLIENCGSGGMRADYGALSHFHLQSSSDQESYENYPSIIGGSLAAVLPEQLGIWAYPYPLTFDQIENPNRLSEPDYVRTMSDGEQTIFNMVNGMCGSLYLSGHLQIADERNRKLIYEAVSLYKRERSHIGSSYPIWPLGFTRINDTRGWACVGLVNEENTRVLLSVWRLGSDEAFRDIPLERWRGKSARVHVIYPSEDPGIRHYYSMERGSLTVSFPKMHQARIFEILFDR